MKVSIIVFSGVIAMLNTTGSPQAQKLVIPIWPGPAPGSEGWTLQEVTYRDPRGAEMVRNVVRPTLTVYLPEKAKANGTAVIIAPGGGFRFLSWQSEGTQVAEWFQAHGVAAFVLKYRLVDTGATEEAFEGAMAKFFANLAHATEAADGGTTMDQLIGVSEIDRLAGADGRQAVAVVRRRAVEWGVVPDRIGIMGFSAGAVVTMKVALEHDADSRPDFAAPIYAPEIEEAPVPADAPPLFVLCASDDPISAESSPRIYARWRSAGVPAELHLYDRGGHGFGMRKQGLPIDTWIERLGDWLETRGLLTRGD